MEVVVVLVFDHFSVVIIPLTLSCQLVLPDKANFLGISIVGQSGSCGDGGIHVGSVMKG